MIVKIFTLSDRIVMNSFIIMSIQIDIDLIEDCLNFSMFEEKFDRLQVEIYLFEEIHMATSRTVT